MAWILALWAAGGSWIPLEAGTEWTFRGTLAIRGGEREIVFTVRVGDARAEEEGGGVPIEGSVIGVWGLPAVLAQAMAADEGQQVEVRGVDHVRSGADGLRILDSAWWSEGSRVMGKSFEMAEGLLWIPSQAQEGHAWSGRVAARTRDRVGVEPLRARAEYRWGPEEDVTVGSETLRARRLEFTLGEEADEGENPAEERVEGTMWLVPGRGPVRIRWAIGAEAVRLDARLDRMSTPQREG
jgi:hypothetical protein